jgi:hypothetical protein
MRGHLKAFAGVMCFRVRMYLCGHVFTTTRRFIYAIINTIVIVAIVTHSRCVYTITRRFINAGLVLAPLTSPPPPITVVIIIIITIININISSPS